MNPIVQDMVSRTCSHFSGVLESCCHAAVDYNRLVGGAENFAIRLPCIERQEPQALCEDRQNPTVEQVHNEMVRIEYLNTAICKKIMRLRAYKRAAQLAKPVFAAAHKSLSPRRTSKS